MSSSQDPTPHSAPQTPPVQTPLYAPPQYVQPIPQYAPPSAQYAPPPTQYAPRPAGSFNVLGLIAFLLTGAITLFWSLVTPFIYMNLYRHASLTFDEFSWTLSQWMDALIGAPLYLIALVLALVGTLSKRRPRGKILAHIALGGSAVGLVFMILGNIASYSAYGF